MDDTAPSIRDDEFRRTAEALPLPAMLVDRAGGIIHANRLASALAPDEKATRAGQSFLLLLDQPSRAAALAALERTLQDRQPVECPVRLASAGADAASYSLHLAPRCDDQQDTVGAIILLRPDAPALLAVRLRAVESRMAALALMAGGVAHHFNNILGGAITAIDFALHSNDTARMQRALVTTSEALARASSLTQSMLVFAEGDRRTTTAGDLAETVRDFVDQWRPVFARKNLALTLDAEPVPPRRIAASSLRIVLGNIAANALDALPPGGTLSISLRATQGTATIRLRDDGPGIGADDLERVFDPFFSTRQSDEIGIVPHLGMGLAAAWGIVRDMGGRITAESQLGSGTTFEIILPSTSEPATPDETPPNH